MNEPTEWRRARALDSREGDLSTGEYAEMNKEHINTQTIEAVNISKSIQNKYGISRADYAELHNAFRKIHTEHLLNETTKAIKEYSSSKQKDLVLMRFVTWIKNHLEIPFKPSVDIEKIKGRL